MSTFHRFSFGTLGALPFVAALALTALGGGCDAGNEGSRCNPFLSHDECGGDTLVCSGPGTAHPLPGNCVENYCCPIDPTKSAIPYCNGTDTTCPTPDAGSTSDASDVDAPTTDAGTTPDASSADTGATDAGSKTDASDAASE
jgi:hypothetical protein